MSTAVKSAGRRIVERRLLVAMLLPLALTMLLASVLAWQSRYIAMGSVWVDLSDRAIARAQDVETLLVNQETGVRGYQITGRTVFLEPYQNARARMESALGDLDQALAQNPAQAGRAAMLAERYREWLTYAEQLIQRRGSGGDYQSYEVNLRGKQRMDDLRSRIARIRETAATARDQRKAVVRVAARAVVWSSLALSIVFGGLLALFSRRQLDSVSADYEHLLAVTAHQAATIEHEERFRILVEGVKDYAIVMLDPDGRVASWNSGAQRIKGYAQEEIVGQPSSTFYTEEDRLRGAPNEALRVAADQGRFDSEGWRVKKNGERFWAHVTITALREADGRLRGFAKVSRDMSEQRRADQEIRELTLQLEQRVVELGAANQELESFGYSVSHDLRAPLRAIDGFSKILVEKYADRIDEQGRHYLARVRAGTQRMAQLIDDLLGLARVTRADLKRAPLDLGAIAREVVDELRRRDQERSVEVAISDQAPAVGDSRLLRVALENLLGNAWKFTSHSAQARIEFGSERRSDETIYFVEDNGAGFDMAYGDRLFAPFQRLHDASEFEGSGIGLATVQRIIVRHGGRVWAEGKPGAGARFFFTLGGASAEPHERDPSRLDVEVKRT